MKRKRWFFALILIPLALTIPLFRAASWRPHAFGVHPFPTVAKRKPSAPAALFAVAVTPDLMMAPDGKRLLSFSRGGLGNVPRGLAMWDVNREAMLWQKQQEGVLDWEPLCFSPDSKTLMMAHNPGPKCCAAYIGPELAFFDAQTGAKTRDSRMKQFAYTFESAAFAPAEKSPATSTNNGVQLWDESGKRVTRFLDAPVLVGVPKVGHQLDIEFSRDAQLVAILWGKWQSQSKGSQMQLAVHDLKSGLKWKTPTKAPAKAEFSPDGRWLLLSALHSPNFEIVEVATGKSLWKKSIVEAPAGDGLAAWMPDSSAIVLANVDQFEFLDARSGRVLRRLPRLRRAKESFVVAPDGNQIYGINADGQISRQRLR